MEDLIKEFKNPSSKFRGKPFWSWNGKLEEEELLRQIEVLKDMGMGGYFCHSRTGLATEYLGREWFDLINSCAEKGAQEDMETWLYDEDRWPSGTAGGMVTKDKEYRMHYLRLNITTGREFKFTDEVICAFVVDLEGQSFTNKKRIYSEKEAEADRTVLYFTVEEMYEHSFYNGQTYVDTMNPEATKKFIELTHEQYKQQCDEHIKKGSIKGIFTDEPHHGGVMSGFALANPNSYYLTPCPKDLFKLFKERWGYDLKDYLPELYLFKDGEPLSKVKWDYMELLTSLFVQNFLMPIRKWCQENGMVLTGHLLHEDNLSAQTNLNGSMLRGYEHMDYPGVDVLWEKNPDYNIAKQLQSAGRQLDKPWLLSELYGCTGWQMTFQDHKAVGDWQSLFGINLRCHHLSWYTMKGEAKRDYPGSIFFQQQWYKEYKFVEDYFSRLNVVNFGGKAVCDTLVISPVESLWASVHPGWVNFFDPTDEAIKRIEREYKELFWMLLDNHIDFDYGDEEQLSRLYSVENTENGPVLKLGKAEYKHVIVASCLTLRASTVKALQEFALAGGKVIVAGDAPAYVDVARSDAVKAIPATFVPFEEKSIIPQLAPNPYIEVSAPQIKLQTKRFDDRVVFTLMNFDRENWVKDVKINIKAKGVLEHWDVRTGQISLIKDLSFTKDFAPCQELVLVLKQNSDAKPVQEKTVQRTEAVGTEFEYRLSEPNIAVLDFVSYRIDDGEWSPFMEILKADREIRRKLNTPLRSGEMLQPWYKEKYKISNKPLCRLDLRFTFEAAKSYPVTLMLETPEAFEIAVNGQKVKKPAKTQWHIDPCFRVIPLEESFLKLGENEIVLSCDFNDRLDLEAIYLLGEFGVELKGVSSVLTDLPAKLKLGDITKQGLPFYSGNIEYILPAPKVEEGESVTLAAEKFGAACLTVRGNGKERIIAFEPFSADITPLVGENMALCCHLTRRNTFGPLHLNPSRVYSYGPDTFLTEGESFLYDGYSLLENGLTGKLEYIYKK